MYCKNNTPKLHHPKVRFDAVPIIIFVFVCCKSLLFYYYIDNCGRAFIVFSI